MITTPPGPEFVKNDDQSGAKSGDHTQHVSKSSNPSRSTARTRGTQRDDVRRPERTQASSSVQEQQPLRRKLRIGHHRGHSDAPACTPDQPSGASSFRSPPCHDTSLTEPTPSDSSPSAARG